MSRVSGKPYFVYILWSGTGRRFYVGVSEDPESRLAQHNEGTAGWTARYRPWSLIRTEHYQNYSLARKREIILKAQKSGRGFFKLTGFDPNRFVRATKLLGS